MLGGAAREPFSSEGRKEAIIAFCKTFVPPDVNEEDTLAYAEGLIADDEYFQSLVREISQCAARERVESVEPGEGEHSFVFMLLPPEGTDRGLDIVRELEFVSDDGQNWTAAG